MPAVLHCHQCTDTSHPQALGQMTNSQSWEKIHPTAIIPSPASPAGIVHFHSKLLLTEVEVFQLLPLE